MFRSIFRPCLYRQFHKCLALWLIMFFSICVGRSQAQVVLKPNGRSAVPLRTKSMRADITIDRQVATTHLVLTFQNETSEQVEADFIYTMPPDSLVTSFAYWYGNEKVIAKVVEKEEAAAIYKHITTRMRDPALVEMIDKNTFRARIFPIMPNSDLKVEMDLVRALPSSEKGAIYTFPLKMQEGETLDSLQMNIDIRPDPNITRVTNANGLRVTHDTKGYHMTLRSVNYRPQANLWIEMLRPPRPFVAALYAAPTTAGRDGFFALSVTPDRDMAHPVLKVEGIPTYEVVPVEVAQIKAYHSLRLFGRYRGSGPGKVVLTGTTPQGRITLSHPVVFGAQHEANNPAARLWASRRMEQLSGDESDTHRETVIALSKQFGMPSKYTSWLAVPREEMVRYEKEIAAAKIATVAHQLAVEMAAGRARSAHAIELRQQFDHWRHVVGPNPDWAVTYSLSHDIANLVPELIDLIETKRADGTRAQRLHKQLRIQLQLICEITGQDVHDQMAQALEGSFNALAQRIVEARHRGRTNRSEAVALTREYHRLEGIVGKPQPEFLQQAESNWQYPLREALYELANQIVDARHAGKGRNPQTVALEREFQRRRQALGAPSKEFFDEAEERWKSQFDETLRDLAEDIVDARHAGRANDPETVAAQRRFKSIYSTRGDSKNGFYTNAEDFFRYAESGWSYREIGKTRERLFTEQLQDPVSAERLHQLVEHYVGLYEPAARESARLRAEWIQIHGEQAKISSLQAKTTPSNVARYQALENRLKQLEVRDKELRARFGDPLIRIEAPANARQVIALMPDGEIKPLEYDATRKRWEARFDIPMYATEGAYEIKIIVVLPDGTRQVLTIRYHVDLTPPTGNGMARMVTGTTPTLRLELDASEDTARVKALLPWGETVNLTPSEQPHRFFALVPLPPAYQKGPITYILTDRAHNRTVITVDMEK